ncbi:uncharacterized protein LOC133474370 isoform X2 [Phyllopteryx taeniolatus]|uniref:uncharacterized protein LOC133474370 isoform X2 n=1 Tax=Phyllopteryx taeniolatus TaxID=161469 RepID=UPI002AD235B1|nr:uncharacterized protein LOC133474370 isoform X2 [Phyllopteryx taeniolatus]
MRSRNEDHEKKISWSCCGGLSGDGRDETAGTGACRVSWQPLAFCRDCLHPSCHGVLAERRTQTASLTHAEPLAEPFEGQCPCKFYTGKCTDGTITYNTSSLWCSSAAGAPKKSAQDQPGGSCIRTTTIPRVGYIAHHELHRRMNNLSFIHSSHPARVIGGSPSVQTELQAGGVTRGKKRHRKGSKHSVHLHHLTRFM